MAGDPIRQFLDGHMTLTRRHFVQAGLLTAAAAASISADQQEQTQLAEVLKDLEPWLTEQDEFRDVSRGKPRPHSLSEEKRAEVGLTRETWRLSVTSDPENPARILNSLEGDSAFTFDDLMQLAETRAVRFPKVMTCLNIGCPLGNGIWEGVPLRDVIWRTQPSENLRRVFYRSEEVV